MFKARAAGRPTEFQLQGRRTRPLTPPGLFTPVLSFSFTPDWLFAHVRNPASSSQLHIFALQATRAKWLRSVLCSESESLRGRLKPCMVRGPHLHQRGAPAVLWPGSWRKAMGAGQATAVTSVTPPGPAAGAAKMSRLFSLCSHCSQPRVGERADNQGATGQGHICPQKKPEEALQAREAEYYRGEGWDKSNPVRAWPSGAAQGRLPDGAASSTQERREHESVAGHAG